MPIGCTLTVHRKRVPIGSLPVFWHVPSAGGTLLGLANEGRCVCARNLKNEAHRQSLPCDYFFSFSSARVI